MLRPIEVRCLCFLARWNVIHINKADVCALDSDIYDTYDGQIA